jgi:hypothetical protein
MGAEEYLTGILTVHFGTDSVVLAHKVHGRFSYMDLVEGDHIEVEENEHYKLVTVKDVLDTTVNELSNRHTSWNLGQSFYEGSKARVKLNPRATRLVESNNKKYAIRQLFRAVESNLITYDKAQETLLKWESDIED